MEHPPEQNTNSGNRHLLGAAAIRDTDSNASGNGKISSDVHCKEDLTTLPEEFLSSRDDDGYDGGS